MLTFFSKVYFQKALLFAYPVENASNNGKKPQIEKTGKFEMNLRSKVEHLKTYAQVKGATSALLVFESKSSGARSRATPYCGHGSKNHEKRRAKTSFWNFLSYNGFALYY